MSEYIDIKNYKCFKSFKIEGLSRINIISGKNNVGKTALLEAFFLTKEFGEGTIAKNRNIDKNQYTNYLKGFSFFISTDIQTVSFKVKNRKKLNEKELEEVAKLNNDYNEFICEYTGKKIDIRPLEKEKMSDAPDINSYINSSKPSNESLVQLYSEIQTKGVQHKFLEYLQKLDSNIKWIEPQALNNEMVLRVNLNNPTISLPTSELGEGVNRYIEILATMLSDNECVFIDEIENGLHYSKLVDIAKAIIEIAEKEDIQLFITTHDKDTIEAFSFACKELEFKNFCSIELYKDEKGNLKSITRDADQFVATIDTGIEVR
jgi:AAA15 family ATPase/GTPase